MRDWLRTAAQVLFLAEICLQAARFEAKGDAPLRRATGEFTSENFRLRIGRGHGTYSQPVRLQYVRRTASADYLHVNSG